MNHSYICIEGNIGAGKTTLAEKLASHTGSMLILEEFEDNPFLPLFYKDPERYALQTELTFLTDRYKQLSSKLINRSLFQPSVIADYFLFKSRLFAKNNLNGDDFRLYTKIFNIIESALPKPGLMVYLHHEVDVLMSNIRNRGRAYEQQISAEYLREIQDAYFTWMNSESRFPVVLINMSQKPFISSDEDLNWLISLFDKDFPPGLTLLD